MEDALTFLGEINIYKKIAPDAAFGDFSNLPIENLVHQLAAEFSEHLELLPYQETGDPMMLNISVYLKPKAGNGRIIAILVREKYPVDPNELLGYVQLAKKRIEMLRVLQHRITPQSIDSAFHVLEQLERKITVISTNY